MQYQSENIDQLAAALSEAQSKLSVVKKDNTADVPTKNGGKYQYKYADLGSVLEAVRKPLHENGLAIVQTTFDAGSSAVGVKTILMHKSGQWVSGDCTLPHDRMGGAQGIGSAITYARRYALCAMVGVATEEDDDDGAGAMPKKRSQVKSQEAPQADTPPPNLADEKQVQRLQILMKDLGVVDRDERIGRINKWLARNGGGEVSTTKELTKQQAAKLISVLDKQVAEQSQAQTGLDPFQHMTQ